MKNKKICAIANCRVSTKEQEIHGNSLNRQNEIVREAAKRLGVEIVKCWSGSRSSKRGKNVNRKDIKEMLDYCRTHQQVKYLIIDEPDRFMRSVEEAFHFEVEFRQRGVEIWYASDDQLNTDDMTAKMMRFMKYFVAEGSNEERMRKAICGGRKALREGRYPYHVKLGYTKGETPGVHVVEPESGEVLKSLLIKIASGLISVSEALVEFNNSPYIKSGKHRPYRIDKWKIVVTDPYYAGIVEMKSQINERNEHGLHEPLISKEQHEKIVEIVSGKNRKHSGPRKNGNPEFPLNTITFCEKCYAEEIALGREGIHNRAKFVGSNTTNGKSNKRYPKYKCRKCRRLINKDELHEQVHDELSCLEMTSNGRNKLTKALRKIWNLEEDTRASEVAKLRTQVVNLAKEKEHLLTSICNVSNPTVIAELENKVEERVAEIGDIETKIEKIENSRNDDRERFLRFALAFADDLGNGFFNLQPNQAKKCELLLFPNGFFVDADKKVHIPKISPFYRYRSTKKASKDAQNSPMVIPAGVEPAIFWMRTRRPGPLDDGTTTYIITQ